MLAGWRADGFTSDEVELWAVGYYSTVGNASAFAQGFDAPCLGDYQSPDRSAYEIYGADVDDVFIIDRDGQVRYHFTVARMDMTSSKNQQTLDSWVRGLL